MWAPILCSAIIYIKINSTNLVYERYINKIILWLCSRDLCISNTLNVKNYYYRHEILDILAAMNSVFTHRDK